MKEICLGPQKAAKSGGNEGSSANYFAHANCEDSQKTDSLETFLAIVCDPERISAKEIPTPRLKCFLGNDLRDIEAFNKFWGKRKPLLGEAEKASLIAKRFSKKIPLLPEETDFEQLSAELEAKYAEKDKEAQHIYEQSSKQWRKPKKAFFRKRVRAFLLKCLLAFGHWLPFKTEIWPRLVKYFGIGKSQRNYERWSSFIKEMVGINWDYRRINNSNVLFFSLKDEYQTKLRKPKKHPATLCIYAEGINNNSAQKGTNSSKLHKLAWWMSTKVSEFHYDNCKIHYQQRRIAKAFLVALKKGISKETLLALYEELVRKYHQIATDQGLSFIPTGICKAIRSLGNKESASEALERVLSRLDCIEANRVRVAEEMAARGDYGASEPEVAPKGQDGGYYSTMEAFYAAQKASEQQQTEEASQNNAQHDEPEQENLIAKFLNRHACKLA